MPRRRRTEDVSSESLQDRLELRPTLDRFADDTSMLGFRYLHTRYKTWFRLVWALVLIFFLGLTVYQVCERIAYYFIRNPLTTRRSYDTPQFMNFPTIGICNKMQIKASAIVERDPDLLRAMCNAFDVDGQVTKNRAIYDSLDNFNSTDLLDIYRQAHQTVDDLFVSCELGKSGSCQDDIRPVFTPHGLCFAVSPNVTVRRPGPETTLSLLLNLQVYEIVPGLVVDPGIMLSIYDSDDKMTEYTQGIHLEAGKVVTIPINEVRKLARYEGTCGRKETGPFNRDEYSLAACQWANTMDMVEKKCGCSPVGSPYNRYVMAGEKKRNVTKKKNWKRRKQACTLKQELTCVVGAMAFDHTASLNISHNCPEDCSEVSFSSVVFGGSLIPSEISSYLPSDWEDLKEQRMFHYQKALEVIPNERIPVVRAVQSLANEAQQFFELANQIHEVTSDDNGDLPCFPSTRHRMNDHAMIKFTASENIWERVTTYLTRTLSRELMSTAKAIGLQINNDSTIEDAVTSFQSNYSTIALSLLQLGSTESRFGSPDSTFGLKQMDPQMRQTVIAFVNPFVRDLRHCVTRLHDNPDNADTVAQECRQVFRDYYDVLLDAKVVYEMANPLSPGFQTYEETIRRITSALRSVSHTHRVKALDWHEHNINLKQFETLYREGGRDNVEILELMKLRKPMLHDIVEAINHLIEELQRALAARKRFLTRLSFDNIPENMQTVENTIVCLRNITSQVPLLKKSPFLRGEWLSRVHRQVQMAQSYSASLQYDQVNLLHIKLYFAHFKQETIVQERSYNVFLLLAEIGGTIGLYVGATLLTAAETVVFFFERRTRQLILKPSYV